MLASDITAEALADSLEAGQRGGRPPAARCIAHVADISDEDQAAATVAAAVERWGRLDWLANIAGMLRTARTHECSTSTPGTRSSASTSPARSSCAAPRSPTSSRPKGSSSTPRPRRASSATRGWAPTPPRRAPSLSFTQSLAVEYCKDGVRANAVAPGSVTSGITNNVEFPDDITKDEGKLIRRIMSPTGFGAPEDVASVVAMLASADGKPHHRRDHPHRRRHPRMKVSIATVATSPPEELAPIAQAADEAGYHAMALADHVLNLETLTTPYPYTADGKRRWEPFTPWLDPLGHHRRPGRGHRAAALLHQRLRAAHARPVHGGQAGRHRGGAHRRPGVARRRHGLVRGGVRPARRSRSASAAPGPTRCSRLLRELWTGGWVEHHGEFYDVPRLEMTPAPPGPVPSTSAACRDAALRRAARHDGWISDLISTEQAADFRDRSTAERVELGRTERLLHDRLAQRRRRPSTSSGGPRTSGVTDILTMPWAFYGGFDLPLQEKIDGLHRFADDIMGPLNT